MFKQRWLVAIETNHETRHPSIYPSLHPSPLIHRFIDQWTLSSSALRWKHLILTWKRQILGRKRCVSCHPVLFPPKTSLSLTRTLYLSRHTYTALQLDLHSINPCLLSLLFVHYSLSLSPKLLKELERFINHRYPLKNWRNWRASLIIGANVEIYGQNHTLWHITIIPLEGRGKGWAIAEISKKIESSLHMSKLSLVKVDFQWKHVNNEFDNQWRHLQSLS